MVVTAWTSVVGEAVVVVTASTPVVDGTVVGGTVVVGTVVVGGPVVVASICSR